MTIWFTVQLDDRPGALAQVAQALADRGVNITGIVGVAEDTDGALMLTTSDAAATREAFTALGHRVRGARPDGRREPTGLSIGDIVAGARVLSRDAPPHTRSRCRPPSPSAWRSSTDPSRSPSIAGAVGDVGGRVRTLSTVRRAGRAGIEPDAPATVEVELEVEDADEHALVGALEPLRRGPRDPADPAAGQGVRQAGHRRGRRGAGRPGGAGRRVRGRPPQPARRADLRGHDPARGRGATSPSRCAPWPTCRAPGCSSSRARSWAARSAGPQRSCARVGIPIIALNMAGSITDHVDLVVSDPVQAGTMAVMAVADTATFDLAKQRGRRY